MWEYRYSDELYHHGVKGMKWGVRKKYYKNYMDEDRTIKKGKQLQNVSRDEKRDVNRGAPVYTSHTRHDNDAYAGRYATNMSYMGYKAYKNTLVTTKDVKIPSQKKAVDTFVEMYNKDPKGVSDSIGRAYAEIDMFYNISAIRNLNAKRISRKYSKKGEEWLKNEGYLLFNQSMMSEKEHKAKMDYYKLLGEKGYDAISDINDVQTGYGADDPIIFINPSKTLKNVESRELTMKDMELATARYMYDEAYKRNNKTDRKKAEWNLRAMESIYDVDEKDRYLKK